jgi:hypothetical protein
LRQACESVFATPELLENHFTYLPAKNIFGITRVSTGFRNCVANSPIIQEMLFFCPSGPPKETWQIIDDIIFWSVNYRASFRRRINRLEQTRNRRPESGIYITPLVVNPCMRILQTSSEHSTGLDLPSVLPSFSTDGVSCLTVHDVLWPNQLLRHLSFLDTFFSRPICEKIVVELYVSFKDCTNIVQTKLVIHQMVYSADAMTPRSALRASGAAKFSHVPLVAA